MSSLLKRRPMAMKLNSDIDAMSKVLLVAECADMSSSSDSAGCSVLVGKAVSSRLRFRGRPICF
jgi:predicted TIM-barrel enzyme